jgi:hypothetical protein
MSISRVVVLVLIVATVGAVTVGPEIAGHNPALWLIVTGLASATVLAVIVAIIRHHRAVRNVWSNQ